MEGNLLEMSCKFELEKSVGCERKNGGSLSPEITGAENWLTGADICIRETNCFSLSLSLRVWAKGEIFFDQVAHYLTWMFSRPLAFRFDARLIVWTGVFINRCIFRSTWNISVDSAAVLSRASVEWPTCCFHFLKKFEQNHSGQKMADRKSLKLPLNLSASFDLQRIDAPPSPQTPHKLKSPFSILKNRSDSRPQSPVSPQSQVPPPRHLLSARTTNCSKWLKF